MVKGLQELGHNVVVLTALPEGSAKISQRSRFKAFHISEEKNVKIFRVWVPPLSYYHGFGERMLKYLSFMVSSVFPCFSIENVDVVWAANPNFFSIFPAIFYASLYRVPIVRNVDDLWPEAVYDLGYVKSSLLRKLLDFLSKFTYVIPKALTPISNSYTKAIVERYGIDEKKITVIEHGVDVNIFHPTNVDKDSQYENPFVVMYSGKLGVAYDFDIILDTAKNLSSYNNIKFVIRGYGEQFEEISSKIAGLSLSNVILDTTYVNKERLNDLLNSAQVLILPNKPIKAVEQGLPTKLLEYQACGKPIICCSDGASSIYISSTKSGIVIKPGDSASLTNVVLQLYKDKQLRQKLGLNGWNHISQNLTLQKIGERMFSVFHSVVSQTD